jgi:RNA polymerase sigma-70 factor (ECF subfamily)
VYLQPLQAGLGTRLALAPAQGNDALSMGDGEAYELPMAAKTVGAAQPSFDECFRRYAPYVARVGLRLLGRDHELDDLVQDVFVAAMEGLHDLRDPEAVRGWLATITVRQAMRRLRTRRLRAFFRLDELGDGAALAPGATAEQRALVAVVYRELDKLAADERVAWVLRHVEGESLEAVAELCGVSLSTVKRKVAAAQTKLERVLGHG